jgi:hypothetical protein
MVVEETNKTDENSEAAVFWGLLEGFDRSMRGGKCAAWTRLIVINVY